MWIDWTRTYVYPGDPNASLNARVRVALLDPTGQFASHSLPQGVGNAGHADIGTPAPGTWTAMVWSRSSTIDGTVGAVRLQFPCTTTRQTGRSPVAVHGCSGCLSEVSAVKGQDVR